MSWYMSVIPASGRWRQEDQKFKVGLGYMRPCLKQNKTQLSISTILLETLSL